MAIDILVPEFFIDYDARLYTGGIAISDGVIVDAGDHVLEQSGRKIHLKNQVIMPGFVNAHSHAFHRLLRGMVERKPNAALKNNFFTWREKMYALANNLDKDILHIVAQFTFLEMLEAGFTHVAEFHYLHHEMTHEKNADPLALTHAMATAARAQKINLTLLECAYQRNNFDEALKPEQQRFAFLEAREYLAFLDAAMSSASNAYTRIGAAIHSVRAVDEHWFNNIRDRVSAHDIPLHIHVSEQRAEVDACMKARNMSPVALLYKHHLLSPATTLVHATHLIGDDLELIASTGSNICICSSTEKNLGDGVLPLVDVKNRGVPLCIGSDQHVRLDAFDDLRSLEEQERLRTMQRLVLNRPGEFLYESLLPCLSKSGLRSLKLSQTTNALIGASADLVGITLPVEYQWHGPKVALDALLVAGTSSSVSTVFTKGERVVDDGATLFRDKNYLINEIGNFLRRIKFA